MIQEINKTIQEMPSRHILYFCSVNFTKELRVSVFINYLLTFYYDAQKKIAIQPKSQRVSCR